MTATFGRAAALINPSAPGILPWSRTCTMFNLAAAFNQPIGSGIFHGHEHGTDVRWRRRVQSTHRLMDTAGHEHGDHVASTAAFNQPIGSWDTSKVTNMGNMFNYAAAWLERFHNCGSDSSIRRAARLHPTHHRPVAS